MNSYWAEHLARQRSVTFAADAHGDQLVRGATAEGPVASDASGAPEPPEPRAGERRFHWLEAVASRSRRAVARAR